MGQNLKKNQDYFLICIFGTLLETLFGSQLEKINSEISGKFQTPSKQKQSQSPHPNPKTITKISSDIAIFSLHFNSLDKNNSFSGFFHIPKYFS
jgi:hypothetical protein